MKIKPYCAWNSQSVTRKTKEKKVKEIEREEKAIKSSFSHISTKYLGRRDP